MICCVDVYETFRKQDFSDLIIDAPYIDYLLEIIDRNEEKEAEALRRAVTAIISVNRVNDMQLHLWHHF